MSTNIFGHPALRTPSVTIKVPQLNVYKTKIGPVEVFPDQSKGVEDGARDLFRLHQEYFNDNRSASVYEQTQPGASELWISIERLWISRVISAWVCLGWSLFLLCAMTFGNLHFALQIVALTLGLVSVWICFNKAANQHNLVVRVAILLIGVILFVESLIVAFPTLFR